MSKTLIETEWTVKMEYDGWKIIYQGEAQPGTSTSSPNWRIKKFEYDGNNVISITWAGGTNAFDKVWDNRSSYNYS